MGPSRAADPLQRSDHDLLQSFLEGDNDAFSGLMERHEDRIFGLCLKMLHNRSDALEASQEVFITAFRRAASFRGDSAFGTWLYRIGINHCKDVLRKRKDLLLESDQLEIERVDTQQRGVDEAAALRLDLSRALAELRDDYREAVVMHDLGGVPYEEIATLTGVPVGTVKSRISRGRRQLGRLLEHAEGVDTSKDQT
ncbi:MAG: sigma-70 family RNA polymerase sigma factor [Actinobacteria bacterium]|nr:sigma-70 family RNA polymerase sigma factor [Actinomycetota bacterium]